MTTPVTITEPTMPRSSLAARRSPLAFVLALVAVAALTACSDPTAPDPTSPSVEVRKSGYVVTCGAKDSTNSDTGLNP